ncbi:MAG: DUF484 family protein [Sneathiellaceae bacterium]
MSEPQDSKANPDGTKAGAATPAGPDAAPLPPPAAPPDLTPAQVAAWLAAHPGFLAGQPELLHLLQPPSAHGDSGPAGQGGNVLDFQRFMIDRLQGDVGRLTRTKDQVIAASRQNASTQRQVHDAVLALLSATSFEHLIHIATADLASILDVDLVTICLESDLLQRQVETPGVATLPPGAIDSLLGADKRILLRAAASGQAALFGPGARLVKSDALVRLTFGGTAPPGLFAFGSREPGRFDAGQGTELLGFLGGVMERCVQAWLDLPRL